MDSSAESYWDEMPILFFYVTEPFSVDPRLYLCLDSANDDPSTPTPAQSTVLFPHKYPMLVPSVQIIELNIGK